MREKLSKEEVEKINDMSDFWKNYMSKLCEGEVSLEYDVEFVKLMDKYIQEVRTEPEAETYLGTRMIIGYCLGKCFIEQFGGEWIKEDEDYRAVFINGNITLNPINKVYKQFSNGAEDSILGLFSVITAIIASQGDENSLF